MLEKYTHSAETRKKISEEHKGKKRGSYSEDHKAKISVGHWRRNRIRGLDIFRKHAGRWYIRCRRDFVPWSHVVYQNYVLNGEEIPKRFLIHHKDGDPENDIIENLEMLIKAEHCSLHHKGKTVSIETRERLSKSLKGKSHPCSLETRKKQSDMMKGRKLPESAKINSIQTWTGRKHTEEAKKKNSDAHLGKSHTPETKKKISETMKNKEHNQGEKNKIAKLKEKDVIEIRKLLEEKISIRRIADIYGVSYGPIQSIKSGKTWVCVDNKNQNDFLNK